MHFPVLLLAVVGCPDTNNTDTTSDTCKPHIVSSKVMLDSVDGATKFDGNFQIDVGGKDITDFSKEVTFTPTIEGVLKKDLTVEGTSLLNGTGNVFNKLVNNSSGTLSDLLNGKSSIASDLVDEKSSITSVEEADWETDIEHTSANGSTNAVASLEDEVASILDSLVEEESPVVTISNKKDKKLEALPNPRAFGQDITNMKVKEQIAIKKAKLAVLETKRQKYALEKENKRTSVPRIKKQQQAAPRYEQDNRAPVNYGTNRIGNSHSQIVPSQIIEHKPSYYSELAQNTARGHSLFESECLNSHNRIRSKAGLPTLVWDKTLAYQSYAHSNEQSMRNSQYHSQWANQHQVGENLSGGTYASCDFAVRAWESEHGYYNSLGRPAISSPDYIDYGHYTQLVWRDTRRVGCGYSMANNMVSITCQYGTPGNVIGQRPF